MANSNLRFSDKRNALETLKLLESEDILYKYSRIKGLLGRAKRTLSITKLGYKEYDINEAIQVFNEWIDANIKDVSSFEATGQSKVKIKRKSHSKIGFKDKSIALESLKLLESKDLSYQRLRVKGLLGRAYKVLKITKDKSKKNNIKMAIKVFEDWSKVNKENGDNVEKKVHGFKNEEKARQTINKLKGRDFTYQKFVINYHLRSASKVLCLTKDKSKLENIKNAINILRDYLKECEMDSLAGVKLPYLRLDIVEACHIMVGQSSRNRIADKFIEAYQQVDGNFIKLRKCYYRDKTWDIVRNEHLKELIVKHKNARLFDESMKPTKEHLSMILWAYSPNVKKLKQTVDTSSTPSYQRLFRPSDQNEQRDKPYY